jgi:hypothetical protein
MRETFPFEAKALLIGQNRGREINPGFRAKKGKQFGPRRFARSNETYDNFIADKGL